MSPPVRALRVSTITRGGSSDYSTATRSGKSVKNRPAPEMATPTAVAAVDAGSGAEATPAAPTATPAPTMPAESRLVSPVDRAEMLVRVPLLAARTEAALAQDSPVVTLADEQLDAEQRQAQALALTDERFVQFVYDLNNGAPLRNEIMAVYPAQRHHRCNRSLRQQ